MSDVVVLSGYASFPVPPPAGQLGRQVTIRVESESALIAARKFLDAKAAIEKGEPVDV